jgi:hypothetical protein
VVALIVVSPSASLEQNKKRGFPFCSSLALVVQRIGRGIADPVMVVRFLPGAHIYIDESKLIIVARVCGSRLVVLQLISPAAFGINREQVLYLSPHLRE